jgi:hypothetical protein
MCDLAKTLDARGFGGLIKYSPVRYYPLYEWPPGDFTYWYNNQWSVACGIPELAKMPAVTPPHADLGPHYRDLTWAFTVSDAFLPHPCLASASGGRILE